MQFLESCAHSLRLIGSNTEPEQMHFLGKRYWISEHSVVVGLGIQFPISEHEHPARSAEAANVREEIEMIQRDLEGLHTSQRRRSHPWDERGRLVRCRRLRPRGACAAERDSEPRAGISRIQPQVRRAYGR